MNPGQRQTVAGKGIMGGPAGHKPSNFRNGTAIPMKRHRKIIKDTIHGITKSDIRRLARRGGVKRIQATLYSEARLAIKSYLEMVLKDVSIFVQHANRKTVTVTDVIFALKRLGRPIYGFDQDTSTKKKSNTAVRNTAR